MDRGCPFRRWWLCSQSDLSSRFWRTIPCYPGGSWMGPLETQKTVAISQRAKNYLADMFWTGEETGKKATASDWLVDRAADRSIFQLAFCPDENRSIAEVPRCKYDRGGRGWCRWVSFRSHHWPYKAENKEGPWTLNYSFLRGAVVKSHLRLERPIFALVLLILIVNYDNKRSNQRLMNIFFVREPYLLILAKSPK